jgi:hypothetical protein
MSKQKIREWLEENIGYFYDDNRITMDETIDIIHQYTQGQSAWINLEEKVPPHKEKVLFKVKYDGSIWMYRSGYAKHYDNGDVLIVIPEFGTVRGREILGWIPLPPTQEA